jgi:hypothetical protein
MRKEQNKNILIKKNGKRAGTGMWVDELEQSMVGLNFLVSLFANLPTLGNICRTLNCRARQLILTVQWGLKMELATSL